MGLLLGFDEQLCFSRLIVELRRRNIQHFDVWQYCQRSRPCSSRCWVRRLQWTTILAYSEQVLMHGFSSLTRDNVSVLPRLLDEGSFVNILCMGQTFTLHELQIIQAIDSRISKGRPNWPTKSSFTYLSSFVAVNCIEMSATFLECQWLYCSFFFSTTTDLAKLLELLKLVLTSSQTQVSDNVKYLRSDNAKTRCFSKSLSY